MLLLDKIYQAFCINIPLSYNVSDDSGFAIKRSKKYKKLKSIEIVIFLFY